jgi:hypothetical protein
MKFRLLYVVLIFGSAHLAGAIEPPLCQSPIVNNAKAPNDIYKLELIEEGGRSDLTISVDNEYLDMELDSILVSRYLKGEIVFSAALEKQKRSGISIAHVLSIPRKDVKSYKFLLVYAKRAGQCMTKLSRYTVSM